MKLWILTHLKWKTIHSGFGSLLSTIHQEITLGSKNRTVVNSCHSLRNLEDTNGANYHLGHWRKCLGGVRVSFATDIYQCSERPIIIWLTAVCCPSVVCQALCLGLYICHFLSFSQQQALFPFDRWVNWGSERLSSLPKVTQLLKRHIQSANTELTHSACYVVFCEFTRSTATLWPLLMSLNSLVLQWRGTKFWSLNVFPQMVWTLLGAQAGVSESDQAHSKDKCPWCDKLIEWL